jgi:hypothetical protein
MRWRTKSSRIKQIHQRRRRPKKRRMIVREMRRNRKRHANSSQYQLVPLLDYAQTTEDESFVSTTVALKWQAIVEKDKKQHHLADARNLQEENWKRWYVSIYLSQY